MNQKTIDQINQINRLFYQQVAVEFDQTRQKHWPGWEKLIEHLPNKKPLRVLDIGCGNGRFGRFLSQATDHELKYTGIDSSEALLHLAKTGLPENVHLILGDVVKQPLKEITEKHALFDVIGCFGVLHHIPRFVTRAKFIKEALSLLAPGGLMALSIWRYALDSRFEQKVVTWKQYNQTAQQPVDVYELEMNDYLLTWKNDRKLLRYYHYLDPSEVDTLCLDIGQMPVSSFLADGKYSDLNHYLVFVKANKS